MTDAVMVAGLSLVGTLAGTFGGIMTSQRLIGYRIEQLEKKVEKHNSVIERTFRLEDNDRLLETKISESERRISDLEKQCKKG